MATTPTTDPAAVHDPAHSNASPAREGEASRPRRRRLVLLATGGTIASTAHDGEGSVAALPGDELRRTVTVPDGVDVEVEQVFQVNSFNLTLEQMAHLALRARAWQRTPGVAGIVVTHGTDTTEETLMALDLIADPGVPVVLTGAQRGPDLAGADGPRNLQDAVNVALSERVRDAGALLVFEGLVWQAAGLRKTNTLALQGFDSPFGPLARVLDGRVTLNRPAIARVRPDSSSLAAALGGEEAGAGATAPLPRVDILGSWPGVDEVFLDAALAAGARGIVAEGVGVGNIPVNLSRRLVELHASGVPVTLTTRVDEGPVEAIYGNGGGADLLGGGLVAGDLLRAPQLRVLTAIALACVGDRDPAAIMRAYLAGAAA